MTKSSTVHMNTSMCTPALSQGLVVVVALGLSSPTRERVYVLWAPVRRPRGYKSHGVKAMEDRSPHGRRRGSRWLTGGLWVGDVGPGRREPCFVIYTQDYGIIVV